MGVQEAPTLPGIVASRGCGWRKRASAQVPSPVNTQDLARGPSLFSAAWVQQNRFSRAAPNSLSPSLGLRALKIWSITHNSLRAFPSTKQALIFPNIGIIVTAQSSARGLGPEEHNNYRWTTATLNPSDSIAEAPKSHFVSMESLTLQILWGAGGL